MKKTVNRLFNLKHYVILNMIVVLSLIAENKENLSLELKAQEKSEAKNVIEITETRNEFIYPSNFGTAGIFRVRSAESLPAGALSFGIGGEFYTTAYGPDFGLGTTAAQTAGENLFLGYSPIQNLTLGVTRRNSSTTFNLPGQSSQLISSLGDFNFSTQYTFQLLPTLFLTPLIDAMVVSEFNNLAPSGNTLSIGTGLLSTFAFYTVSFPTYIHANVIYHSPQMRSALPSSLQPETFFQMSRYNRIQLALAGEIKLGDWIPFIELTQTIEAASGLSYFLNPSKFTIGTRLNPFENKGLSILLGCDVGLGRGLTVGVPYNPSIQAIGQLSYTFGLNQSERKHYIASEDVNIVNRKFVIRKNIQFKLASSDIEEASMGLLDQIAKVILENKVKKLLIVGHTDSSHTDDYNDKLSLSRANSVKKYLVTKGVTEEILMTEGYGKKKPRASNLNEKGRFENRRVEFFVLE